MTTQNPVRRLLDVDAVRGFALLGIFVVNVTFMASGYPGNLVTDPGFGSGLDNAVRTFSSVFVDMKFYVLFSFLFGYSFTLQMEAASRAGAAISARMLRRIGGLLVLGALHTVFLYGGDVLTTYAVACLTLLLLRNVKDRTAIWIAVALYALVLVSLVASALLVDRSAFLPGEAEALANGQDATRVLLGGWGANIGGHIAGLPLLLLQAVTLQGPTALGLFLLGMVAGRRQWLARVSGSEPVLRRIQWIGFPVGLLGSIVYAASGGNGNTLGVAASVATAPLLAAAYVATLLRVMHDARTAAVQAALAPAGRMALTNYLGQSVAGLITFTGIGFGLAGTFSPLALFAFALAVFVAQLVVSALWLRRFRYGPVEWALRWLTNARRPAFVAPPADPGGKTVPPHVDPVPAVRSGSL
ncbi:DUF418 domain-containing protein [Micromonospora sagamiensis]|uniref:DUF418 domain-containing protein n=1 Tax=Micromonospora sagamiensis TaxID=47875 RepID=A0A562W8M3_9ACTN|nr:DUF418 domain-containing protein [Micromonospora sagamiensis]TWJ26629.1 uncharacterized protein JD81_00089 [Micromonospora sagamiensis]BCL14484.1 membrane protein [Micromonospora sagamiensis]